MKETERWQRYCWYLIDWAKGHQVEKHYGEKPLSYAEWKQEI